MNDPFEYEKTNTKPNEVLKKKKVTHSNLYTSSIDDHKQKLKHFLKPEVARAQQRQSANDYLNHSKQLRTTDQKDLHKSDFQSHYLGAQGVEVSGNEIPRSVNMYTSMKMTSSEILNKVLDEDVQFIQQRDHVMESLTPLALNTPILSPGLTSIDTRKYIPNFSTNSDSRIRVSFQS